MAKNVSITEDGNSKIIENAARIRTSLVGGGTCDWIPKDDAPLQKLTVTEDGMYRPEENYYGFSQVTARGIGNVVEGELIEKTITKNGTYNIKDENGNPYGYSKIIVNIDTSGDDSGGDSGGGGGGGITGKDEDGNDTMAETDEDGNIVMTALPTEIKVVIPPTKLEYNRYEEIDYSGISVYAYISKAVHWLGATTTAISEGSVNGTVIIDGKSISVSVGDGVTYSPAPAVTYHFVWDGSKWVKPSNYSAEKALWKSDKYPTGKIPFEELIFQAKRANGFKCEGYTTDYEITNSSGTYMADFFLRRIYSPYGDYHRKQEYNLSEGFAIKAYLTREVYISGTTANEWRRGWFFVTITMTSDNDPNTNIYSLENIPSHIDHRVSPGNEILRTELELKTNIPTSYDEIGYVNSTSAFSKEPLVVSDIKRMISDLKYRQNNEQNVISVCLPVQWKRPGDGKILETTFTAWMKDDEPEAPQGGNG